MALYEDVFKYKLIYIMSIDDEAHFGHLKIGEATLASNLGPSQLPPNCEALNEAAHKRIKDYTKTALVNYTLLHSELAVRFTKMADGTPMPITFSDKDIHDVLARSGYACRRFPDTDRQTEWYPVSLSTAIGAITAYKEFRNVLTASEKKDETQILEPELKRQIVLRQEQEEAIERTLDVFRTQRNMLWNCKMRYGKTLTTYELIRRAGFKKTIVVTHRPVVEDGWKKDHELIFNGKSQHIFITKKYRGQDNEYDASIDSENDRILKNMSRSDSPFVYFTSMQDLRGSKIVGGKFNKNNEVFNLDWDFIVYDEAHEGTQTELGKNVQNILESERNKKSPKVLSLSGTPYNILGQYEENVYTWDYVMEQRRKLEYKLTRPDEVNPYADLPEMRMYTFDLHTALSNSYRFETTDVAFNFREFFRTWTGNRELDFQNIPEGKQVGDFVHAEDVRSFLDLLTQESESSNYPFSNHNYRAMFRHTFWMVPGVKEARALSKMLKEHPIFSSFAIANVAGEGDMEESYEDALVKVRNVINDNPYTITISCGKLTTGVTVPEWSAVLMLTGSSSTSAAGYMQTIFRVQSVGSIDGKQKEAAYVFDFAPDRALNVISEVHSLSIKEKQTDTEKKQALGEFLNFCPVIAVSGTNMTAYDVPKMMRQLKKITVNKAIKSGFDDETIYKDGVGIIMSDEDVALFNHLSSIINGQAKSKSKKNYVVNKQGLTEEEYERAEKAKNKSKRNRTEEENELIKRQKEQKKEQEKVIRLLRAVSIRLPMLIYGAEADLNDEILLTDFVDLVDDESWEEFMPENVTKELFIKLIKYYDEDVVIGAGVRIRRLAKAADELPPTRRVERIAEIFSLFKNPDKETVLTPWRVVNMHLGDTLGGYNFYKEGYHKDELLEEPRYADKDGVTALVTSKHTKVLEINSKSGLYPLYMTYSIYRKKLPAPEYSLSLEEVQKIWESTLAENVFILCKTKMAKSITKRTLSGYKDMQVNAVTLSKLLERMQDKKRLANKLTNPETWGKGGERMKFDVIVGNPPYNASLGGASDLPIYHHFVDQAKALNPRYLSMIIPAKWFNTGTGLGTFRQEMLNDERISELHDYINARECFHNVELKGGVVYFLWDREHSGPCDITTHNENLTVTKSKRNLLEPGMESYIRNTEMISIYHKVRAKTAAIFSNIVSSRDPFGYDIRLEGSFKVAKHQYALEKNALNDIEFYYNGWKEAGIGYVSSESVNANKDWVDKYKILIPKAWGSGKESTDWLQPFIVEPHSVCTETYLVIGPFDDKKTAENAISYIKTRFFHAMVSLLKISQNAARGVYNLVPMQDFNKQWTDEELYRKYEFTDKEIAYIESTIKPNM